MAIRVFVDQGHNPGIINAGAQGNGLSEHEVNFMVGMYLSNILNNDPRFEARTSRRFIEQVIGTNIATSLSERVSMANEWPANYFISLHCNANENPAINGSEVYVYQIYTQSYYLGEYILQEIVRRVGTRNNLVRVNPNLYVLRNTDMPAVLVELGYITNPSDAIKLRDNQYQFAYAIYVGLLNYLGLPQL